MSRSGPTRHETSRPIPRQIRDTSAGLASCAVRIAARAESEEPRWVQIACEPVQMDFTGSCRRPRRAEETSRGTNIEFLMLTRWPGTRNGQRIMLGVQKGPNGAQKGARYFFLPARPGDVAPDRSRDGMDQDLGRLSAPARCGRYNLEPASKPGVANRKPDPTRAEQTALGCVRGPAGLSSCVRRGILTTVQQVNGQPASIPFQIIADLLVTITDHHDRATVAPG